MPNDPDISPEVLAQCFPGGFTLRDEANALVALAFRNGPLENLHAGRSSRLLENPSPSRITDEEMKELILYACEELERLLRMKETDPAAYNRLMMATNLMYCRRWVR